MNHTVKEKDKEISVLDKELSVLAKKVDDMALERDSESAELAELREKVDILLTKDMVVMNQ